MTKPRQANAAEPSLEQLRHLILKSMGDSYPGRYPEGAAKLLDAYAAKLKERWARIEGELARMRAEDAIREAIDALRNK